MKYTLIGIALMISTIVSGQDFREARTLYNQGNFKDALVIFEQLLKKDSDNPQMNQMAGECVMKLNDDQTKAVTYLSRTIASGKHSDQTLFLMAEAYARNYQFDKAIDYYNQFLQTVSKKLSPDIVKRIIDCQTAKELMKYPVDVVFTNMGSEVNSEYPDYNPYVSGDENYLLFNSRRKRSGTEIEFDGFYPADIYQSKMMEDAFAKPEMLSINVNTKFDDLLVGMSYDGNEIYIYFDDLSAYGDLYSSTRSTRSFQRKELFDLINTTGSLETAAAVSPDGESVVFATDRRDGFGKTDLYIVRKLPNGEWSDPLNLGPEVNTPMNEDNPHFSADGRYLYFSSNGHPGMGSYDLYLTEWNPENYVWTKPKNLGYPINTPMDDRNISFNHDGNSAYLATWREDSHGDLDIYRVDFGERHNLPALISVQVPTGDVSSPFINAEIKVSDQYDELVGIYRPHPKSGKYVMALNPGKYYLQLDADGYQPYSELIMISDYYAQAEQNVKVIRLDKIAK